MSYNSLSNLGLPGSVLAAPHDIERFDSLRSALDLHSVAAISDSTFDSALSDDTASTALAGLKDIREGYAPSRMLAGLEDPTSWSTLRGLKDIGEDYASSRMLAGLEDPTSSSAVGLKGVREDYASSRMLAGLEDATSSRAMVGLKSFREDYAPSRMCAGLKNPSDYTASSLAGLKDFREDYASIVLGSSVSCYEKMNYTLKDFAVPNVFGATLSTYNQSGAFGAALDYMTMIERIPRTTERDLGTYTSLSSHRSEWVWSNIVNSTSPGHRETQSADKLMGKLHDFYQMGSSYDADTSSPLAYHRAGLATVANPSYNQRLVSTATQDVPTPAALASRRGNPTAPARISIVRRGDSGVKDDSSSGTTSDPSTPSEPHADDDGLLISTVPMVLPGRIFIAAVEYCLNHQTTVPRLVEHVMAAFLNLDPEPDSDADPSPPKKGPHLKSV